MKPRPSPRDALTLLASGHEEVEKLIREFERRGKSLSILDKGKLVLRLCRALILQARLKRDVLLPAAGAVLPADGQEIVGRSRAAQEELVRVVVRVEGLPAGDPGFEPAVLLLGELARQVHAREAEELAPHLRHSGLDLQGTGERMAALAAQLATAPIGRRQIRRARRVMSGGGPSATGARARR